MYRRFVVTLCALLLVLPAFGRGRSSSRSSSRSYSSHSRTSSTHARSYTSQSGSHSKPQHVRGYTTKTGKVVHPYNRAYAGTAPKHTTVPRTHYASTRTGSTTHSPSHRSTAKHGKRSAAAKDSFKQSHPCPSTGKRSGACPGYTIDHVNPLACGGADAPSNMQWQTTADAKAKDKWERKGCR